MKRLLTLIICLLVLHIVKAAPHFVTPSLAATCQTGSSLATPDTIILPVVNQPAPLTSQSNVFKRRLDSIKKDVPLDYNEYVQSYIDIYAHNRDEMGRVVGLTKYYFPITIKLSRMQASPNGNKIFIDS